jgi:cysteinyl-tRNA synthetase
VELFLTNTLTRQKEKFVPANPGRVSLYVCGPTVYNYAHIGNGRPFTVYDVLFRVLRRIYGSEAVIYARNFTDIDDRIIDRAEARGETIATFTAPYIEAFHADMAALGNLSPTFEPRATAHVDHMCALIERLLAKGAAYQGPSGVWFCVAADEDYGKLSKRSQADQLAGARVEGEADKRHPSDFALWKATKPGEPSWPASFGDGRPGWHIECSAMIKANLGDTIDIHAGGLDLIFPHHENEIAQSETAYDAPLARYWLHNGFLTMDSEKMSKSLGNVALINDLRADHPGEVLRWALLSGHYRAPLDFTDALLEQSRANLDRLYGALWRLADVAPAADEEAPTPFIDALLDDLNTPKAMAELFALAGEANRATKPAEQAKAKAKLLAAGAWMGVLQADPQSWFRQGVGDAEAIDALVGERAAARASKNWAEADRLRADLSARGIEVMDGAGGSRWRRVEPKSETETA